ncbi:MAG TPA: proton-conducting transporter membrane subunit, partial [Candidatus Kapabacteria bacterium]|nr:proton-conducting transporter membrane subunit [Candidatus Kapabacteria bacterium]
MFFAVLSGFIVACIVPLIFKLNRKVAGALLSILPLSLFIYYLQFIPNVLAGEKILTTFYWIPFLKINLNFLIDGLNLTFALIISGIGFVVYLYASAYLEKSEKIVPFYIYISIFMASMLGVVTCDNTLALFVFWELTSISSFLLIGFNHEQERSRYAALQSLLVTAGGGLALLAGVIMLGQITGTYEISQMSAFHSTIVSNVLYPSILVLFLIGTFTKSAQFPFHFWLPNAMEAPTPVSAYLHSATMVKAGVFLMIKFLPILGGTDLWMWLLGGFGG